MIATSHVAVSIYVYELLTYETKMRSPPNGAGAGVVPGRQTVRCVWERDAPAGVATERQIVRFVSVIDAPYEAK